MISDTAARVTASLSTAACNSLAMNSPPRVPTPATLKPRLRLLADQRAEIALVDQVAHRDLIGDVGEQRAIALMQHAAVETVGRRREADHLELRD